jgi:hypothetical protein
VRISSGAWDAFVATAWNGTFEFPGLSVGHYDVEVLVPDAYASTSPVRVEGIPVQLGQLTRSGVDFGLENVADEEQTPVHMPVTGVDPAPALETVSAFARSLPRGTNVLREELPSGVAVLRVWVRGCPAGEYSLR